eukprot:CAMPEP_0119326160 /NCGR_PEP_ID=MMETSP1333-20130426/67689_1 /TAXON_ID=418940 /ORGANISM="Scyphosphaera apsteinii, Strain RCC1455" /LENGTH=196 /DNA_ID=CAMNT_0007334387 /DNA_START=214 /DNA_END=803 /DNA_ORIENTATION=+
MVHGGHASCLFAQPIQRTRGDDAKTKVLMAPRQRPGTHELHASPGGSGLGWARDAVNVHNSDNQFNYTASTLDIEIAVTVRATDTLHVPGAEHWRPPVLAQLPLPTSHPAIARDGLNYLCRNPACVSVASYHVNGTFHLPTLPSHCHAIEACRVLGCGEMCALDELRDIVLENETGRVASKLPHRLEARIGLRDVV